MAKKTTFDEFIAKATAKKNNKKLVADIHVNDEFGKMTFNRPSNDNILQFINNVSNSLTFDNEGNIVKQDTALMFEASQELIYTTCPFLQKKELHEALEIVDPLDTVAEVFGIETAIELAEKIKETFEGENVTKKIKN